MLLRPLQHFIVRRRFPFVIVRLTVIFPHRMILKLVPHQNPPQIGMTVEADAVQIENFALLEFGASPDRRERWQMGTVCAISCAHANDDRAMFMSHRVKVINRLEIPGNFLLSGLDDLFFLTIDELLYLRCFLHHAIEPIDAGDIGAKIQAQRGIDAQKSRYRDCVLVIDQ